MKIKISKSQWEKIGNQQGWIKKAQTVPSQTVPERVSQLAQKINAEVVVKADHFQLPLEGDFIATNVIQILSDYKDLSPHIMILNNQLVVFVWSK